MNAKTVLLTSGSNVIRTHNHLVRKRTLNHLAKRASLAKWLSVRLRTKWLWVLITLLSLKPQIWCLIRARSSLTFRQTIECRFTLKLVRDMIITYRHCITYTLLHPKKCTLYVNLFVCFSLVQVLLF